MISPWQDIKPIPDLKTKRRFLWWIPEKVTIKWRKEVVKIKSLGLDNGLQLLKRDKMAMDFSPMET